MDESHCVESPFLLTAIDFFSDDSLDSEAGMTTRKLAFVIVVGGAFFSIRAEADDSAKTPLRMVIIGDSTVCAYPATSDNRGWGQFIEEHFKPGEVTVVNLAASGRSTKTFISEGRWRRALAEKPDLILIQFGHNDSHGPRKPESTEAATDYKEFLRRYIDDSRAIGATAILVTPMVRRIFKADEKLQDELAPYAKAMKEVGVEKNAAVIDLHASSKAMMEKLGPVASAEFANKPVRSSRTRRTTTRISMKKGHERWRRS